MSSTTAAAELQEQLAVLLPDFLARQRWYAGDGPPASVEVVDAEVLVDGTPGLIWLLVSADGEDAAYQVPVGLRPLDQIESWLEGKGRSLLGDVERDEDGPLLAYDALIDPDLVPHVYEQVAPGTVEDMTTRALNVEMSNTSVIVGEEAVLKVFRRVHDGANPDAEVVEALHAAGFDATPRPLGTWRRNGRDLAVARAFLAGSADGWSLALTSLRDLYDRRCPPEECGGDFAPDAERLGSLVARMHLSLADAFGRQPSDPAAWAESLADGLADIEGHPLLEAAASRYVALARVGDPGQGIRIHGDLHLGQLLRNDEGWYVLDFEGEPRVPLEQRRLPSSPLRDVAGMLRSFHYASQAGMVERHEPPDDELVELAGAWEDRASSAFISGYLNEPDIGDLLPTDDGDLHLVLSAFELGKAVYEVGYEREHRPDWERIPRSAIERLLV